MREIRELAPTEPPRVVYIDLDGTLLGPGGSLYAADEGGITRRAALAVAALHEAEVEMVPLSGRTAVQIQEVARLLGGQTYIAELGGITCYDLGERTIRDYGAFAGDGTPFETMERGGVGGLLIEAFPGLLEPHDPWTFLERECSVLLRGHVETGEVDALLESAGFGWLHTLDNGVIRRTYPGLRTTEVHAYHVLPRGVTKAGAAAADMERRGLPRERCIAIGDSPADAALAGVCGAAFIVANGRADVERAGVDAENLYATVAPYGDGFAEVIERLVGTPHA